MLVPMRGGKPAAAAAVLVLLGIAAAASGSQAGGGGPESPLWAGRVLADTLVYVGIAWALATLVVVVWALAGPPAPGVQLPERPTPARRLLAATVAALVLVAVFYARRGRLLPAFGSPDAPAAGLPRSPQLDAAARAAGPGLDWMALSITAGLLLLLAFVVYTRFRRRPAGRERIAAGLERALDESLDDLHREQDARRAVIACYARMERALGAQGLARRAAEAPFEYLERALARVHVSAPQATALTQLFERAKFSRHAIDADMKAAAIEALESIRAEVRGPAGSPDAIAP